MNATAPVDCRGQSPVEALAVVRQRYSSASLVRCVGGPNHDELIVGSPDLWSLYVVPPQSCGGPDFLVIRKDERLAWRGLPCLPGPRAVRVAILGWYEYRPAGTLAAAPRLEWHAGVSLS